MHSLGCQTMTAIYREFVHFIWTLIIRPSLILNTIWSGISDYSSTVINSRMPPTLVWYTNKQSRGTKVLTRICPCDVLLTSAMLIAFFPSIWQYIMSLLNTTRNEKKRFRVRSGSYTTVRDMVHGMIVTMEDMVWPYTEILWMWPFTSRHIMTTYVHHISDLSSFID